jgi:hypothetical protein
MLSYTHYFLSIFLLFYNTEIPLKIIPGYLNENLKKPYHQITNKLSIIYYFGARSGVWWSNSQ